MKIYVAASFDRREEMRPVAGSLLAAGHLVTSSWIASGDEERTHEEISKRETEEIIDSDLLLLYSDVWGAMGRGGKLVEFGFALGRGIPTCYIGQAETIFHRLPQVRSFVSLSAFLAWLRGGVGLGK